MNVKTNDNLLTYSNITLDAKEDFYRKLFNKSKKTEERTPKNTLLRKIGKSQLNTDSNTFTSKIYTMFYKYNNNNTIQNEYSYNKLNFKNFSYNRNNNHGLYCENSSALISPIFPPLTQSISSYKYNTISPQKYYLTKERPFNLIGFQRNMKKFSEIYLTARKNNERIERNNIIKSCDLEDRKKSKIINEHNILFFNNEYNKFKTKEAEKQIIVNEINNIGKKMSWVKKHENKNQYSAADDIFYGRLFKKNPVLEINQTSNLPTIMSDKNLITNLWRNDMSKYSKFTLDLKKPDDQIFYKDLLSVYEQKND